MIKNRYKNIVVDLICRVISPFILLFGLYVVLFGHYSPGGGFQGGTILAAAVILLCLSLGRKQVGKRFPIRLAPVFGAIGLLIYGGTGLVALLSGGMYLDYAYLPIPGLSAADKRYLGILLVEVGVALGVFGVLVAIFDRLTE